MLDNSGISTANYDAILQGWAAQTVQNNINLGAGGLFYCNAEAERQSLIDNFGWTIEGDAVDPNCSPICEVEIIASATEICAGESVDLSINNIDFEQIEINTGIIEYNFDAVNGLPIEGFQLLGEYNNHYYYKHNTPTSWLDADTLTRANGGYLACLDNQNENDFVWNSFGGNKWIGYYDSNGQENNLWVNGQPSTYENWRNSTNEPNTQPGEPYTMMSICFFGSSGNWVDLANISNNNGSCYSDVFPVMEVDPSIFSSSTFLLWSTGETTENITITPTETTEYWVDVTNNGVTCREYITINVVNPEITASATEICAGESVDLSVTAESSSDGFSNWYDEDHEPNNTGGSENWGEIYHYDQPGISTASYWNDSRDINNVHCAIEYDGLINSLEGCNYIGQIGGHSYFYKEINGSWFEARDLAYSLGGYLAIITSQSENDLIFQNIPVAYNEAGHAGIWIGMYQDFDDPNYSEPSGGWLWLDGSYVQMTNDQPAPLNILWSTGETTENITVTPTETTEYWVDVTTNGVTCREYITINVLNPEITASATEICAGESVDLSVNSGLSVCDYSEIPSNLQNGLVGYWPFCNNANDESLNNNNGSVNGATLTTDRFGSPNSAYEFTIVDSYINAGNNSLLQFNSDFSYSVHFNVNEITTGDYPDPGSNIILNNEGLFELGIDINGNLAFAISTQDPTWSWINISTILVNEWNHLVFTYQQGIIKIFFNGSEVYSYSGSSVLYDFHPELNDLRFGDRQLHETLDYDTSSFNGKIDDVALWDRALTTSEIQQLTNNTTYLWSTGDTTPNINVTPTETTEYWVDVTTNGVTCRDYITINVDAEDPTWVIPPSDLTVACDGSGNTTEFNNWLNNTFLWNRQLWFGNHNN